MTPNFKCKLLPTALLTVLVAVAWGAAVLPAPADALTRSDYVTALEGVCKPRTEATKRAMKGVRADVKAERLKIAAAKFATGTRIFSATVTAMSPIPRPEADRAKLKKWFGLLAHEEMWLRRITGALRDEKTIEAQRDTAHFIHSGNLANNVVIAFGFNYCRFKFSSYG
jgi:hypothetical protein